MRQILAEKLESTKDEYPVFSMLSDGALPSLLYKDDEFDFVVCYLVLCLVNHPRRRCEEVRRVLKSAGKLLFLEHVVAPKGTKTRWFHPWLDWIWYVVFEGCHTRRDRGEPLGVCLRMWK